MIDDGKGPVDYDEHGSGPTVVFVPGSCSTGAAWRPVIAAFEKQYRCVLTSLLGYGGTAERRTAADTDIDHEIELVERVVGHAGGPVHLVGHSFGALIAIATAMRARVRIASLSVVEAPAVELLRAIDDQTYYQEFRDMTEIYFSAHRNGTADAIGTMVDFYGGAGTFAGWPTRVRAYAIQTTPTNLLDWSSAFDFAIKPSDLAVIDMPTVVLYGTNSHRSAKRANTIVAEHVPGAELVVVEGAAHFMIATHPLPVARAIENNIARAIGT